MNSDILEAYSRVILAGALSLKKGDRLWLRSEPVHRTLLARLARMAYEIGAEHVQVTLEDPLFNRVRVDHSSEGSFLDYVPGYTAAMYDSIVEEGWRSMALRGLRTRTSCVELIPAGWAG